VSSTFFLRPPHPGGVRLFSTLCPTVYVGDSANCHGRLVSRIPHRRIPSVLPDGWIFTHIPFGHDIAFRLNIMKRGIRLLTVHFLYLIVYHFTRTPYLSFSISLAYAFSRSSGLRRSLPRSTA